MNVIAIVVGSLLVLLLLRVAVTRSEAYPSAEMPTGAAAPSAEESIRESLLRGRKIDAIKIYRQAHGVDLKAAKEAVEELASQLPREA